MDWRLLSVACLLVGSLSCGEAHDSRPLSKSRKEVKLRYRYCNLDSSNDRREAIEERFARAHITPERVSAIVGKDLQVDTLIKAGLYDAQAFMQKRQRDARPGEIGYHFSFLKYLSDAAQSPDELIVHFDDDAIFLPSLDKDLRAALDTVPSDWDVLFLGCNRDRIVGKGGHILGFPGYEPIAGGDYSLCPSENLTQMGATTWYKLNRSCVAGSYAVIVTAKKAQELLPLLLLMRAESDMALSNRFDDMNAYCIHPALVDVAPVLSTIK